MATLRRARRSRLPWPFLALSLVLLFLPPGQGAAAGSDLELTVKAAYIYNFIQFIDWQEEAGGGEGRPIRICMVGDNEPFGAALSALSARQVKGRPIQVEQDVQDSDGLDTCQIVVIDHSQEEALPAILAQVGRANVLTVSDIPRFAQRGGAIGFVTDKGRVRIEINARVTQQAGLRVSAKLLEVARLVP